MSEEVEPHILKRYEIIKKIGRGAYGIVWKARDKRSNEIIALKKIWIAYLQNESSLHYFG